jgi:hypothetical protein
LTLPTDSDLNDVAGTFAAYNSGVESRLVQRYLSATDRSIRNPTPNEGEISYLQDVDLYEFYNGTAWETIVSLGAWQGYTPTWGAVSGTQPVIGNGTLSGRYQKIGKTVHLWARILMGSTTTYGVNQWTLSLPVPALAGGIVQILPGRIFDASAPNAYLAVAHLTNGTTMTLEAQGTGETDAMAQGIPITWAAGDYVVIQGTYEAA